MKGKDKGHTEFFICSIQKQYFYHTIMLKSTTNTTDVLCDLRPTGNLSTKKAT